MSWEGACSPPAQPTPPLLPVECELCQGCVPSSSALEWSLARLSGERFEADEERRDGGGTMTEDRRGAANVVFMALDDLASSGEEEEW